MRRLLSGSSEANEPRSLQLALVPKPPRQFLRSGPMAEQQII